MGPRDVVGNPTKAVEPSPSRSSDAEHRGDEDHPRDGRQRLHETWITPFDRSDIHPSITRLDDVLDLIEAVGERVVLFEITEVLPIAVDLARVLLDGVRGHAQRDQDPSRSSQRRATSSRICVEINRLENEADALYRRGSPPLPRRQRPDDVMKCRDIFDNLEEATDRCEDVANVLEGVVLEYA